jgi:hypothetical protein
MIRGALDGTYQISRLEPPLEQFGLVTDMVALPDGRVAVGATGAIVTVIGADGTVEWEKTYADGQEPWAESIAYDAARNELVVGGHFEREGLPTWMIALDLQGNQTWELTREPQITLGDGEVNEISPTRGPSILDVAVSPSGAMLALGSTESQLTYFSFGTESCE